MPLSLVSSMTPFTMSKLIRAPLTLGAMTLFLMSKLVHATLTCKRHDSIYNE